ncbi:MAG: hypothetical protein PHW62_00765 [Candidatus Ratteibacteria bacterium]|nr:hypothetical protein [Candidatus Ratteibacteria bacterium]
MQIINIRRNIITKNESQKENWYIAAEKDTDGLYCLKKKAREWIRKKNKQGFTLAIFFHKIHEYKARYEFIRNDTPIAILNKVTAQIRDLDKVQADDIEVKQ